MKKNKTGAVIAIVLCLCSFMRLPAQQPDSASSKPDVIRLTVDQAVDYAMEHSRTLKSAQIDLEIKRRAKILRGMYLFRL